MVCVPAVAVELLPPSYGGDGEKGRADDAGISSAPYNGGLPPQPQPERNEGGEAQPPSDGQAESRALDVMPVAFAAAPSCAVAPPANGSMEDGKHIADSLNVAGKSSQLVRDDGDVTGNGDGRVVESSAEDGELDREKDESRQKRWSASVLNPPPKRRAVSAKRKFPPGCGRDAVTSSGLGGSGASPVLRPDNSNHEIEGKSEEVGGATEAHNQKIQESRVVKCGALDDFAGGQNRRDHLRNDVGCGASPILRRDGFNEEMERKIEEAGGATEAHNQKIQEWQVVKCVALDGFAGGQNSRDRLRNDVGCGASPILSRDDFNEEMERKIEEAGGATEAHNQKIQELQVVKCVALDDFAGSQNSRDRLQNDVGCGASPILRRDDFNEEMERKIEEAGGATEAHNQKIQEWQVVKCVALDDFAGGQNSRDRLRNDVGCGASPILRREEMEGNVEDVGGAVEAHNQKTQESQVVNVVVLDGFAGGQHVPRHGFFEKMYDRRLLRERKRTPLVVRNGEMRSKLEGRLHEGTSRTHSRGPLNVKGKGSEIVNINVTLLDDVGFLRDGVVSNKTSSTLRDVVCLPSKCGHHVATNQIEDKDSVGLTTNRIIVQALMAPDQSPWTQRMKSIGSVSKSLAPRNNVKKKIVTPRKKSRSKVTPSTSARDGAREDGEDFSSEDAENSLGLLVHENNNESCITLPQCTPSSEESVGTRSKVMKIDVRSRLRDRKPVSLVAEVGDVKTKREGGLQKGTSRTHVGALVNVKTKCKKPVNVKVNVTLLDDMRVSEDDKMRNQISRPRRGVARSSNNNMKKCMFGSKLKHDGISKGSLNKLMKESKCVDHIEENDNAGLVTNKGPVLALMAPEKCPWTQGKGTIAGVSQSLTCRNNSLTVREGFCLLDISQGKESIPICVINTIDDMLPMPFKYITKVIYPPSYEKASSIGCDCTNGCSDSIECACAVKNGGELPFNLNSAIIYTKPLIYECGPSCRCPPTCHNRVSQHGPKVPLELFKTGKTGWGVRSLSFIPSGSFICEYVGEVLQETEAERTENDEYLFDIGRDDDDDDDDDEEGSQSSKSEIAEESLGYTIDAAKCGNVGRFINHSCSPNMHAQDVLWDHDDKKMPHVMLFAEKNIRPLQELTYDYNYNIGNVHKNGKVKEKKCFCGSSKCRLRLY